MKSRQAGQTGMSDQLRDLDLTPRLERLEKKQDEVSSWTEGQVDVLCHAEIRHLLECPGYICM